MSKKIDSFKTIETTPFIWSYSLWIIQWMFRLAKWGEFSLCFACCL